MVWKPLHRAVCLCLALIAAFQINSIPVFAASEDTSDDSLKRGLSRNGNVVTEYVNDEDHRPKTIIWANGITPPKMGGDDSQFEKHYTYDKDGKLAYIDYISPFIENSGWYDVNKSPNFIHNDANLCFAAAASNSLHWWMDVNADYIDQYIAMNPDDKQIQRLTTLRDSFKNQQESGVYDIFLSQFANKKDGYWADLLHDQFINGYYPKADGGTNDSPADRDKLMNLGPDKNGGFFFKVMETERLTDRQYYQFGFETISQQLKTQFMNGNLVLMTYTVGVQNHVVTLWGAEFDKNGTISAVYYTDSDDEASQGMVRVPIINVGGKAVATSHVNGEGKSTVVSLEVLSPGTRQWNRYFRGGKRELKLRWNSPEMVYNGKVQAPTVTASNIDSSDNVTLTVEGGGVNAGSYTATAVLSGPDADNYKLPEDHTYNFEIKKAPAPDIKYPSAEELNYGQKLRDSSLTGGSDEYGRFAWRDADTVPAAGSADYAVEFIPSENTEKNYEALSYYEDMVSVTVNQAVAPVSISADVERTDDSNTVNLSAKLYSVGYGDIPTGTVTFTVTGENGEMTIDAVVENGVAEAVWNDAEAGTYTVRADYSGDQNYTAAASDEIYIDELKKAQDAFEILSIEPKIYGDDSFVIQESGGSGSGEVSFESLDPDVISIYGNTAEIRKAGTARIMAIKAGDETYQEAKAFVTVVVNKKEMTVTADDKLDIMQGDSMPEFTYTVDGLVNGDKYYDPNIKATAKDTSIPGEYDIIIQGGKLTNAASYAVTFVNGELSILEKVIPPVPDEPDRPEKPDYDDSVDVQEDNTSDNETADDYVPEYESGVEDETEDVSEDDKVSSASENKKPVPDKKKDKAPVVSSKPETSKPAEIGDSVPAEAPVQEDGAEAQVKDNQGKTTMKIVFIVLIILVIIICAFMIWRFTRSKSKRPRR